jgi:cell filamentation protein
VFTQTTIVLRENPIKGNLDFEHLLKIHKYVFSELYDWAGELRTVNIAKGNQFCNYEHLQMYTDGIFKKLKEEKCLLGVSALDMPVRLTYYLSEINVLHPFREGNGRAQRIFIEYLAQAAGFYVDFSTVDSKEMIEASALSFGKEYGVMTAMFERILSSVSPQEQQMFRKKLGLKQQERN